MRTVIILFLLLTIQCKAQHDMPSTTEFVLSEGMSITATNPNGTVTIRAGHGTERTFSGKGWSKKRYLIPRDTRWYGSFGLYDPGESYSPYGRLLADEGRLFFKSESEALRYLFSGSGFFKPVFTNHGLVVGYDVDDIPGGEPTRSVQLWQIYINGSMPTKLRGADDSAITINDGTIPEKATPHDVPVGLELKVSDTEYVPAKAKVTPAK